MSIQITFRQVAAKAAGFSLLIILAAVPPVQAQDAGEQAEGSGQATDAFGELDTRSILGGEDVDELVSEDIIPDAVYPAARPDRFEVDLGAGLGSYTSNLGNTLEGGLAWGLRGIWGAKSRVALEVGYEGTANKGESIAAGEPLGGPDAVGEAVYGTLGEALARLNFGAPRSLVRPFIAGGAGYLRLDSDSAALDNLQAVSFPLAAGLQVYPRENVSVGLRGSLRLLNDAIDDDLPAGNQYGGLLTIGSTF